MHKNIMYYNCPECGEVRNYRVHWQKLPKCKICGSLSCRKCMKYRVCEACFDHAGVKLEAKYIQAQEDKNINNEVIGRLLECMGTIIGLLVVILAKRYSSNLFIFITMIIILSFIFIGVGNIFRNRFKVRKIEKEIYEAQYQPKNSYSTEDWG